MFAGVGKNIRHNAHRRQGWIDKRIAHHKFFEDVVLNGAGQFVLGYPLAFGRHNKQRQNWRDCAIHGHGDAHGVQRNAREKLIHV